MHNRSVKISDPSLRDGNHAVGHQLKSGDIRKYAAAAEKAGIDIIEVGHGNGLGASSSLLGHSLLNDREMLEVARSELCRTKLGVHFIPGFGRATDIDDAIAQGVDIFRIASHVTESNVSRRYVEKVKEANKVAYGVLMMAHMATDNQLLEQAKLLESYGVDAIIYMDSAGSTLPHDIQNKFMLLNAELNIETGFHGHNNLGLAIANSIAAVGAGATIVDACARGFGAGAGNTQLESLIAVFEKLGIKTSTSFRAVVALSEQAEEMVSGNEPSVTCDSIASGMHGLFSGYSRHVKMIANDYKVDRYELYERLASRKLVAGQEDIIIEEAKILAKNVCA
ncbi:4-hydroxy-2-oxovalerate aldolase [Marinobacter salarius]|jgi:4-hydroxy 2-oxovalerate aldolase|uniref:4-hydroxy-2-oxovalerate aldolase n=1 Tax=Marinobacter salarius TaxID=1420917 RepID=UPI00300ABC3F|tara:strand:- start:6963 stop:7976 length:1014 start_codon:yes stop_codon:yes gene_type:complete